MFSRVGSFWEDFKKWFSTFAAGILSVVGIISAALNSAPRWYVGCSAFLFGWFCIQLARNRWDEEKKAQEIETRKEV